MNTQLHRVKFIWPRWRKFAPWVISMVVFGFILWEAGFLSFRYIAPSHAADFDKRPQSPALIDAAGRGDCDAVQALLDKGVSPDAVVHTENDDTEGRSALSEAADKGQLQFVKLLLRRGADINATDFWGGSAATSAAVSGQPEVLQYLIDQGANVSIYDDDVAPLDYAEGGLRNAKTASDRARFQKVVDE